jgi:diaminohydroxyphosphoribosylaminopyrimidine deaminase/5-amino-6-(5-phosphoribosylamino)uracil reductase
VGAVVVRNGRVVGAAFHRRAGGRHAEVLALRQAGARAQGSTLYVTLEPCCHLAKLTPPCVPLIQKSGVRRVVIATRDPNPKVHGSGIAALRHAGIDVKLGVGQAEAAALIEPFRTRITLGRPFVMVKIAATLDGKIATARRESRWITGKAARSAVQRLRASADGVLVGIGTVLADDPSLTVRTPGHAARPVRIILDPRLRIPLHATVLNDRLAPTLVVTTSGSPQSARLNLERKGAEVLVLPEHAGRIDWKTLLEELGRRGMNSLLIEGGAEVNASALRSGAVDRVIVFLAPKLMGGHDAVSAIGGRSPERLADALSLHDVIVSRVGSDIMVEGRVRM